MKTGPKFQQTFKVIRTLAVAALFTAVVVVLMIWLAGAFKEKIGAAPGTAAAPPYAGQAALVKRVSLPMNEEAVGSVRPVHEMVITSRVAARITELKLTAGQQVTANEVLMRLDDRDLKARVAQAQATLDSARATRDQATIDRARVAQAHNSGAATKMELDAAELALKNAESNVLRNTEIVNESQAALAYTTILAPSNGVVVDRKVNVGDTIMPGQVLATLYDPSHMQLVASVREALTQRLKVGQAIGVRMESLPGTCAGIVSEIVPEAESASRTFQVKVTGPCPPGIYSGMFGRIVIPLDSQEALLIPRAAVSHVGQLDLVEVVKDGRLERRIVRLGRPVNDNVEVLSGLAEGEQVAMREMSK